MPKENTGEGVSVIRVLVAVANKAAADMPDMQLLVDAVIAESNQGYINSDVPIRLESAGTFRVNFDEVDGGAEAWSPLLKKLRTVKDAELGAPVHALREQHSADVVVMLVDMSGYGGLAYTVAAKTHAYSLVKGRNILPGYFTFAHEIGHNIGAAHNPENPVPVPAYPYGYGYRQDMSTPRWRTIMSYDCDPSCSRKNYWSNPRKTMNGLPMGTIDKNDVARTLTERGPLVADFYPAPPPITAMLTVPASVNAGAPVPVRVDAFSSTGKPLSYEWFRTKSLFLGSIGNNPTGSYTAAQVSKDETGTIRVTVMDGTTTLEVPRRNVTVKKSSVSNN
jgi:hypothetical protein